MSHLKKWAHKNNALNNEFMNDDNLNELFDEVFIYIIYDKRTRTDFPVLDTAGCGDRLP